MGKTGSCGDSAHIWLTGLEVTQKSLGVGEAQLDDWVLQDGLEQEAVGVDALVQVLGGGLPVSQQPLALEHRETPATRITIALRLLK